MSVAVKIVAERIDETQNHLRGLNQRLIQGLSDLAGRIPELNIRFNSLDVDDMILQSPSIVNFSFPPVEGEVLLHHLEEKQIYVGLGSACSANSKEPSQILKGIGLSDEEARCSLRVSFSINNTIDQVDMFLKEFAVAYENLYSTFKGKEK
jgi:cysteine desulfurase